MKVRDAIQDYFRAGGIPLDGGYNDRVFVVKLFGLPFVYYNSRSRVRAARIHDVHHVMTGFKTNLRGEALIGAWELASGCGRYAAAWLLDLASLSIGLIAWPQDTWRAFLLGRRTRNFYGSGLDPSTFEVEVDEIRRAHGFDSASAAPASFSEIARFGICSVIAILLHIAVAPLYLLTPLNYLIYRSLFDRNGVMRPYRFLKRGV